MPNISQKLFDSKVFRNFVDAFRAFGVCRQIRTATHFAESFKKPSGSKFIYKAVDATAFWRDLSGKFHSTKVFVSKVFAFYDMDFPIEFHAEKSKNCQ